MQTHTCKRRHLQKRGADAQASDNLDVYTRLGTIFEKLQELFVADLGIVDPQLLPGLLDKGGELAAGIDWTYDECLEAAGVGLPVQVGIEKPDRLLNDFGIRDHQTEPAAVLD